MPQTLSHRNVMRGNGKVTFPARANFVVAFQLELKSNTSQCGFACHRKGL